MFRRNPRPVPAVSTAQIDLLSLGLFLDGMVWSDCLPVSGPLIFVVIVCRWCRVGGPRLESVEIPKCPKLGGAPGCRSAFAGQRESDLPGYRGAFGRSWTRFVSLWANIELDLLGRPGLSG